MRRIILKKSSSGEISAQVVQITTKDGVERDILVAEEVILAAGTIKSPQLLGLSGIGDTSLLASHGIEVMIDNPNVGKNLQDHGMSPSAESC
jgi:choline dehydrogenase-like flavoprotein